ncbi:MAG: hypothetical protein UIM53_03885 [Acutalibacteraceae bacterium]|nr:hypothetical protein [Acutalibacteraceae bacterium]
MTYSVKNGTWCKDNNKEYYSATKTGLKAALKAGEISTGTKVVIHEPRYHTGQLIQSLNPECPEGCFVPHGQTFDTSIYEELAKIFPSGVLPDMRECVMVCAGQNTHITTHEHDVFNAGEFKDDCSIKHSHEITVSDPGHKHTVNISDPGHKHTVNVSDPGHTHSVSDPGHQHAVIGLTDQTVFNSPGGGDNIQWDPYSSNVEVTKVNISGTAEYSTTNVSIINNTTGITASSNDNTTGITAGSNNNKTGITASCSTAGTADATVTRTKQFGVYYYIAF